MRTGTGPMPSSSTTSRLRRQLAAPRQHPGGTHSGVTSEWQLPPWGEDAHTRGEVRSRRTEDERCFGQIHLNGNGLHFRIGKTVWAQKYGELVTTEDAIGKDVDLDKRIAARHAVQHTN